VIQITNKTESALKKINQNLSTIF